MNEKDYNEVEIEVYDEKRVDKKDIDITKTPWYKIVKCAVAAVAKDDPVIRSHFCSKRKEDDKDEGSDDVIQIEDK